MSVISRGKSNNATNISNNVLRMYLVDIEADV